MALLKFKRSAVSGKAPALSDLGLGELAINTFDGKLYMRKDNGTASIIEVGGGSGVLSFNSRTGAVTLSSSDVTTALGYTPANKAGDTFTGAVNFPGGSKVAANGDVYARRDNGTTGVYYFADGGSKYLYWDGGQYLFGGSFNVAAYQIYGVNNSRAPIFYDSDNTAYYVDPSNYSNLYRVNMGYQKLHNTPLVSFTYDGAVRYQWNKIATLSGTGILQFEITSKTDSNYIPFEKALVSIGTYNGTSFSIKMDGLSSYDGMLSVLIDNSNNVWVRSYAVWTSFFNYRILHEQGGNTIYEDSIVTQEANPTGIAIIAGQQVRGTQGSASSASISFSTNRVGCLTAQSRIDAPIYYDSNNTGYYVDPASTSNLNGITYASILNAADGNYGINGYNGYFDTVNSGVDADALELCYVKGSEVRIGTSGGNKAIKASLFYKGTNTSYYLDPAGRSNLSNITVASGGTESGIRFRGDTLDFVGRYSNYVSLYNANGPEFKLFDSNYAYLNVYGENAASWRAPIFYDSNDTGYYIDPNTTATSFRGRGEIFLGPNSSYGAYLRIGGNGGQSDYSTVSASNGNLHIDAQSGYNLYLAWYNTSTVNVGGSLTANGNITAYSDIRVKDNVETIANALDKLSVIRGVTYTRTDMEDKERRYAGVIAQEIEQVLPEAIFENVDYKSVDYNATIGLLIEAVKELTNKVETLEANIRSK